MKEAVLPQSDIDECSLDAGHHLGNFAKVDVTDHFFLIGSLDEQLCQATILRNCNTGLVGASVYYYFLLHAVRFVPTFLRSVWLLHRNGTKRAGSRARTRDKSWRSLNAFVVYRSVSMCRRRVAPS